MQQVAIPATSKYWDNKQISLTEKTKKTILKKAYTLDAEALLSQYNVEGEQAADALAAQGVPQEQLAENPNSYSFIALTAIDELESNSSKDARVDAILKLVQLGFTNVYEDNTKNFISPPADEEKPEPEAPKQQPKQEEQPTYQYTRKRPVEQPQPQYEQPPPEEYYQPPPQGVSPYARLSGASRFIPNTVRQVLPMRGPNNMTPANISPARMSPNPGAVVRPNAGLAPQRPVQVRAAAPTVNRPVLNRDAALRLGGNRLNVVQQRTTVQAQPRVAPRPRFGLRVKR